MAATAAKAIKAQIDKETESYRQLQQDVQKNHTARLRFTQQLSESKMVKEELDRLDDEAVVYKLVGPALIRYATAPRRDVTGPSPRSPLLSPLSARTHGPFGHHPPTLSLSPRLVLVREGL